MGVSGCAPVSFGMLTAESVNREGFWTDSPFHVLCAGDTHRYLTP